MLIYFANAILYLTCYYKRDFSVDLFCKRDRVAAMKIKAFRDDLRAVMARKKASQTEVTKATGVKQSSLSLFLAGERSGLSGESVLRLYPFVYGPSTPPEGEE